jgi:hypothetical protein
MVIAQYSPRIVRKSLRDSPDQITPSQCDAEAAHLRELLAG